jgi:Lipase (class 3)
MKKVCTIRPKTTWGSRILRESCCHGAAVPRRPVRALPTAQWQCARPAAVTSRASSASASRGGEGIVRSNDQKFRSLLSSNNWRGRANHRSPSHAPALAVAPGRDKNNMNRYLRNGALPLALCACGYSCSIVGDPFGTSGSISLASAASQLEQQRGDDSQSSDAGKDASGTSTGSADERPSTSWNPTFDVKSLWADPSSDKGAAATSKEGVGGNSDTSVQAVPNRPRSDLSKPQSSAIHTSVPSSSPNASSSGKGWEDRYLRLARDAMAFVTGTPRSRDRAIQDLVEQVRSKREHAGGGGGDIEDKTSFSSILSLVRQQVLGDICEDSHDEIKAELERVASKYFENIQLSSTFPSALWGYLEHEDERKNPSWKRRVHRFCQGIYMDQLEEFYRGLLLAYFAYGDTPDEIRANLEKRGYELLYCDLSSAPGKPAHYVAVQRTHTSSDSWFSLLSSSSTSPPFSASVLPVVIVVRGTKTLADAMTDLLCDSCEYRGGRAHSYIVTSGKYLAETQAPLLKELAALSGLDLQVTLVGHSLGAGAATIAGIELANSAEHGYNVNVVGFGCPALLSKDLAASVSSFVTTIINDSDVVPRMSGASIANLLRDVSAFDWFPYARRDIQHALDELFPAQVAKSIMATIEPNLKSFVESSRQDPPPSNDRVTPELYPPGRCIHFYSDGVGTSAAVVQNDFFKEIDVSRRMVEGQAEPGLETYFRTAACASLPH